MEEDSEEDEELDSQNEMRIDDEKAKTENEDEEMATRILLQRKDAQIRELERDFEMDKCIINYYNNEHKYFKKIKMGLALQKNMAKNYAMKNKLACAKLKEALIEIQAVKGGEDQARLGILASSSLQVSQTP